MEHLVAQLLCSGSNMSIREAAIMRGLHRVDIDQGQKKRERGWLIAKKWPDR